MPYLGNIPATQFAELKYQDFTGGTGTSFTLNDPVGTAQELEVFVNNVRQEPGVAYTVSGTALTMTGSIVASDDFYVVFQGKSTGTATHPSGQALTATDGTFTGNLDVSSGNIKLDGNYPTGTQNVALGDQALDALTTGANNTAVGHIALSANTEGVRNVALGGFSLNSNTTGNDNVGIGTGSARGALHTNTTGSNNVAVGANALGNNTTASNNTAVGMSALYANTTGTLNTMIGGFAGDANTTGSSNTGVGINALGGNTSGGNNVSVGQGALNSNTTASNNTALGYNALTANTTATSMVAVGERAGNSVTTNSNSTFVGQIAGRDTTGGDNTFIGQQAGYSVTSGAKNTIIGRYNGNQGGLDIRTASNHIVLSDGDGNPRLRINDVGNAEFHGSQYVLGINSGTFTWYMGTNNNRLEAYDGSGTLRGYLTLAGAWTDTSDTAFKRDISDMTYGITTVKALQPRVYHVAGTTGTDDPQIGFVAQEIEAHVPEVVSGEDGSKGVSYGRLTAVLTKALQEAIAKIETLETKVAALEAE